jgi:sugar phosphate isomerase/epimerase
MGSSRIGCSTATFLPFSGVDLGTFELNRGSDPVRLSGPEALKTLAGLGFQVVDIPAGPTSVFHVCTRDAPADQTGRLVSLVQELGLEVNSVQMVVDTPGDLEELRRQSTACADIAADLGAEVWIYVGQPAGPDRAADLDQLERALVIQHRLAAERGLRLAIEMPHSGMLGESYEEMASVLSAIDEAGVDVALDLDTSHVHNCGASPTTVIREFADRIAHVAIRDTIGPHEWSMPLGEGDVDFRAFLDELRSTGFGGDLMLEVEPGDVALDERIALIEQGRAFLDEIVQSAELREPV